MPTYTHTTPYQPNGYTPITYGTENGVIGNTFMTNFPYQDNGYAPITYGSGNGPNNQFFNTFPYQDNGYAPIIIGTGIGPNNPFYQQNQYQSVLVPPAPGTTEYLDWLSEYIPSAPVFRSPNVILLSNDYPNAGEFLVASKDGIAESENDVDLNDIGKAAALGLLSGLTSNTAVHGLIGNSGKQKNDYKLVPKDRITDIQNIPFPYQDYRREIGDIGKNTRVDGAAALLRGSALAGVYSAASLAPGGAYTIFNLESTYGFGSYTGLNLQASKDFTSRSNVATRWKRATVGPGKFIQTINPIELATQFRGDKVNVIDFGSKTYSQIYKWRPPLGLNESSFGSFLDDIGVGTTRDFIKFYFTGPKLTANPSEGTKDDVLVFRAIISSLTDTFNASWNPVKYIGRADPNYTYQGYGRQFDVNFTVYANDRDEMKPMYRKLNYLASYTAPTYSDDTLTLQAPLMRVTIGDLLVHQPVVLTSVYYTFVDGDTTWETNLLKDPTAMEVPFKVEVSIQFNVITDYLPQKGGKMYTLAKQFTNENIPREGKDNWLSDSKGAIEPPSDRNLFQRSADSLKSALGDLL